MPAEPLCAHCRQRPVDPGRRPFCSARCRLADLGRWLGGEYRIPGDPATPAHPAGAPDDVPGEERWDPGP